MTDTVKRSFFARHAATLKVLSIGVLILLLLIPMAMVESLIDEREGRKEEVINEITDKWGQEQVVIGPLLAIPYEAYFEDEDGNRKKNIKILYVLPDELNIKATISPTIRYRSIYEAVLYESEIRLSGRFSVAAYKDLNIEEKQILFSRASIVVGISDIKGIREQIRFSYGKQSVDFNPGVAGRAIPSGVSAKIDNLKAIDGKEFAIDIALNGSQSIRIIPVGKTTKAEFTSSWPHPSFNGAFLPVEREVTDAGFSASWNVLHFNRSYPQALRDDDYQKYDNEYDYEPVALAPAFTSSSLGVDLLITADVYQQTTRTAKYAVMFIMFTFVAFFFSEVINKSRIHPIQYLLVGFALITFYTLLIAISEHLNFDTAYAISSLSVITLITSYAAGVLKSKRLSLIVGGILLILYVYLYILLQLEDYALLMGSIGLFTVLAVIMYVTRQIDWYKVADGDAET